LLHRACPRVAPKSPLFTEAERVALEYADATTATVNNLHDAVFARLREHYDGQIEELTMLIARENASSRFNRAFRVPSAVLWRPAGRESPGPRPLHGPAGAHAVPGLHPGLDRGDDAIGIGSPHEGFGVGQYCA
jgi:hypothetical protein